MDIDWCSLGREGEVEAMARYRFRGLSIWGGETLPYPREK